MKWRARALVLAATLAATITFPAGMARAAVIGVPDLDHCVADAELTIGSSGPSVTCLQTTLAMMDIYSGKVSGEFDEETANAVRFYQGIKGNLRADGIAGPNTLTALQIFSGITTPPPPPPCTAAANVELGESGADVLCLQQTLAKAGLLDGEADGIFGQATLAAVRAYQSYNPPLVADGIAGPRTLAALGIWNGLNADGAIFGSPAPGGPWPAPAMDFPEFRLTLEGIPFYGSHRACTRAEADTIASEFAQDGADVATQQWAVYVASREGGCNYQTVNYNMATQDDSHCTFQLNVLSGTFNPTGELGRHGWTPESIKSSLEACADAASDLWVYCGRGPWMPPYYCRPPWQSGTGN